MPLLAADEPPCVIEHNMAGRGRFVLTVDHADRVIPRALGDLGLPDAERARHIGWDIGILGTSRLLAGALDAPMVGQRYSRLVVDCNRTPGVASSIPKVSERTVVPGNAALSEAEVSMRVEEVFAPYHARVAALLDGRLETVLVAMHSFTPVYMDVPRPWHIGVLYNRDARLARPLLALLRAEGDLTVGDNEPYFVSDETDYGIPVHGERRGLPHVELEIRQDLIADEPGQRAWASRLARLLTVALARMDT